MPDERERPKPSSDGPAEPRIRIDIISVLPEMLHGPLEAGVIGKAREAGILDIRVHDLRDWAKDKHRTTDDYAYGGGGGMVMKPEPVFDAVEDILGLPEGSAEQPATAKLPVIMLTPQGAAFDHAKAQQLAAQPRILLLAGHYEGFDERIREYLVTEELSVGDFVLTGGEIPALLVADAVARLQPGVLGSKTAAAEDSFAEGLLEHPHYTRPATFRGWSVPEVLRSGDHGRVAAWRREQSLRRTFERRPDCLEQAELSEDERLLIARWLEERTSG